MKALAALVSLILLPAVGTIDKPPKPAIPRSPSLSILRSKGNTSFRAHNYLEASRIYEAGYRAALQTGDVYSAARFLGNIGSCRFAVFQYRPAMQAFLEARQLAEQHGDLELAATTSCNISSLYLQMGELNAGIQAARRGLQALEDCGSSTYKADLLAQEALLRARQDHFATAEPLFYQAIDEADGLPGKLYLKASAWELLGYEFLERSRLDSAERAFLEAFRLRKLGRLPDLQYSFYDLGMLSLARRDPQTAIRLLTRAIQESSRMPGALPLWRIHYQRGRALKEQGRTEEALADFQRSVDCIRRWRVELLPAETFWRNTAVEVEQVYAAWMETAVKRYLETGDARLLRASFEAAEENRAVSLRAVLHERSRRTKLPDDYWQTLAHLREADMEQLNRDTPAVRKRLNELANRLTELEMQAGLDLDAGSVAGFGPAVRRGATPSKALRRDEAYLSFQVGDAASFLWVLTRQGLQVRRLAGRAVLAPQVREFRRALSLGRPDCSRLGRRLYEELFGGVGVEAERKRHWLLALDGVLFELPFAALVTEMPGGRPAFLIESHSLEITPAVSLLASRSAPRWEGPFIGVGDPVYNSADARWTGSPAESSLQSGFLRILPRLLAGQRPVPRLEMARLPLGGREVRRCAAQWSSSTRGTWLLEGMDASAPKLRQALGKSPAVVHFATHFLMSPYSRESGVWPDMSSRAAGRESELPAASKQAVILLSLTPDGRESSVSAAQISAWSLPASLVVLSGCSSGSADALPGDGLMGLTHAWLSAGAGAVVASYWPTPDDNGELFQPFYRSLREEARGTSAARVAAALRRAQLAMLRSESWRSLPRYWAAYFCVGKE